MTLPSGRFYSGQAMESDLDELERKVAALIAYAQTLREAVMSPAGTTIAAIREMENHKVRAAFLAALEAARDRRRELASGHE